jgi:benzil reductase ((S)-benzoin forming)
MLSETFYLEEKEKGRDTKVYAVAPGVVNTNMEAQIRSVEAVDFTSSRTFHDYYRNGELAETSIVAQKIQALLRLPYEGIVSVSLREIALDL